jgi:uncharacterized protein
VATTCSSIPNSTVDLLDGGATVPFVARYRKEITGALDDAQLRTLEERLGYLRELEERRAAILESSIASRASSTPRWKQQILAADSKARLEDIYLPFKPKRRTKAEIAREAGLEPLAELLLTQPQNDPQVGGRGFVDATRRSPTSPQRSKARARSWSSASPRRRPDRRVARADVVERP